MYALLHFTAELKHGLCLIFFVSFFFPSLSFFFKTILWKQKNIFSFVVIQKQSKDLAHGK